MVAAVESMAYVAERGTPWHGIGTAVDGLMTAAEALEKSGLDWDVEFDVVKNSYGDILEGRRMTQRSTDHKPLGTVGRTYQIIQNRDAFAFADNLVDDGSAKYETAGSLWGGRRVFLSMELDALDIKVKGDESATRLYLILTNNHDGGASAEAAVTPVRVVCQNTLNMALSQAKSKFKIRHTGNMTTKLLAARKALEITFKYAEDFGQMANRLALKKVTDEQILEILRTAVFPIDEDAASEERIAEHASTLAFETYATAPDIDSIRGTAWGALNGIVDFIDYGMPFRGKTNSVQDVRANSLLWGNAQTKKQAALKALLKV